jgi:hypothetical protein
MRLAVVSAVPKTVADRVMLASARLAGHIGRGKVPSTKDLFLLSAALVESAKQKDEGAVQLTLESVMGLLDSVPMDGAWDSCRGHLTATMGFAWLLLDDHDKATMNREPPRQPEPRGRSTDPRDCSTHADNYPSGSPTTRS